MEITTLEDAMDWLVMNGELEGDFSWEMEGEVY